MSSGCDVVTAATVRHNRSDRSILFIFGHFHKFIVRRGLARFPTDATALCLVALERWERKGRCVWTCGKWNCHGQSRHPEGARAFALCQNCRITCFSLKPVRTWKFTSRSAQQHTNAEAHHRRRRKGLSPSTTVSICHYGTSLFSFFFFSQLVAGCWITRQESERPCWLQRALERHPHPKKGKEGRRNDAGPVVYRSASNFIGIKSCTRTRIWWR